VKHSTLRISVRDIVRLLAPVVVAGVIIVIWQLLVHQRDVARIVLPAPSDVWTSMVSSRSLLWEQALVTLRHAVVGVLFATLIGVLLAIVIWRSWWVSVSLKPIVVVLQAIPVVAIAPAFVLWFGLGPSSKYVTVGFVCVFPVFFQALATLTTLPQSQVDVLRVLHARPSHIWRHVAVPQLMVQLLPTFRLLCGLGIVGAVVAEWSGTYSGLGALLQSSRRVSDSAQVWACVATLALLVLLLTGVVAIGDRLLRRRYRITSLA